MHVRGGVLVLVCLLLALQSGATSKKKSKSATKEHAPVPGTKPGQPGEPVSAGTYRKCRCQVAGVTEDSGSGMIISSGGEGMLSWAGLAQLQFNKAVQALQRKNLPLAEACLLEARSVLPREANILFQLGRLEKERGEHTKAAALYKQALHIDPANWHAHTNLGNLLLSSHPQEAFQHLQRAAELRPDKPDSHWRLVQGAIAVKKYQLAVESARRYLEHEDESGAKPNIGSHEAWYQLSIALDNVGDMKGALAAVERAIANNDRFPEGPYQRGQLLQRMGQLAEAVESQDVAIRLRPGFRQALVMKAQCLFQLMRFQDALASYTAAMELEPDNIEVLTGILDSSINMCDFELAEEMWPRVLLRLRQARTDPNRHGLKVLGCLYYPMSVVDLRTVAEARWSVIVDKLTGMVPVAQHPPPLPQGSRFVIVYAGSEFKSGPVSTLFQNAWIHHDRGHVKVLAAVLNKDDLTDARRALISGVDTWLDLVDVGFRQSAEAINAAGAHALINLTGYTKGARTEIFAFRPARVQVTHLGMLGTMGASAFDWIITDPVASPPEFQDGYTERLAMIPRPPIAPHRSLFPAAYRGVYRDVILQHRPQKSKGQVVYCSFNRLQKLDRRTFDAWMRIVQAVDGSKLWLVVPATDMRDSLIRRTRAVGLEDDRIHIDVGHVDKAMHLRRAQGCDIALDTPVYNGGATTADILWAGIPVVTMPMDKMSSRSSVSMNAAGGSFFLIAHSMEEYEIVGTRLGRDPRALERATTFMRNARIEGSVFDAAGWVLAVEDMLMRLWDAGGSLPRFHSP